MQNDLNAYTQIGAYSVLMLIFVFGAKVLLPKMLNDFREDMKNTRLDYLKLTDEQRKECAEARRVYAESLFLQSEASVKIIDNMWKEFHSEINKEREVLREEREFFREELKIITNGFKNAKS